MAKSNPGDGRTEPLPPFLRGDAKRAVILRAAQKLFLRDGFSATSMDAVTAEAGVSKATVYAHFSGKQQLYEALVTEGSESAMRMIPPLVRRGGAVSDELTAFFEPLLTVLFVHGGYAWDRMVAAESTRHPDNAKLFHDCTIERVTAQVEEYVRGLAREKLLVVRDPRSSAELLLSMVLVAPLHRALLLGPERVDFRESLTNGVALFLRGLAPETRSPRRTH